MKRKRARMAHGDGVPISSFFTTEQPAKRVKLLDRSFFVPRPPEAKKPAIPEPDLAFVEKLATEYSMSPQAVTDLVRKTWRDQELPLSVKYQPESVSEIIQSLEAKDIKAFLKVFSDRSDCLVIDEKPQALLIKGPPGSGKTALVRAACKDLNLKLIEVNSSSIRSGAALQRVMGESTQTYSVLHKQTPTVVLLDDVDIILDADKGFFKTLLELVSQTKSPIVATCTKVPEQLAHKEILRKCKLSRPSITKLRVRLEIINYWERLSFTGTQLEFIARLCRNDIGRVLNLMQCSGFGEMLGLTGSFEVESILNLELKYQGRVEVANTGVHARHQLLEIVQDNSFDLDIDIDRYADFQDLMAVEDLAMTQPDRGSYKKPKQSKTSVLKGLNNQLEFLLTYWSSSIKPEGVLSFKKLPPLAPFARVLSRYLSHMGSATDHISFLQSIANLNVRQMSLRSGRCTTELEVVLRKYSKYRKAMSY